MDSIAALQDLVEALPLPGRYVILVSLLHRLRVEQAKVIRYLRSAARRELPLATKYGHEEFFRLAGMQAFCLEQISITRLLDAKNG